MNTILQRYQDWFLALIAILIILVIAQIYIWGMEAVFQNVSRSLTFQGADIVGADFKVEAAKEFVKGRGLIQ